MPNGDRTGPAGAGSRTGRGMGYCVGNIAHGSQAGRSGRGMQRRGCGNRDAFGRTAGLREEMEALRMQMIALGQQLAVK